MVPTFTCGLVRLNFSLAIVFFPVIEEELSNRERQRPLTFATISSATLLGTG
jgi:hypothetical protein